MCIARNRQSYNWRNRYYNRSETPINQLNQKVLVAVSEATRTRWASIGPIPRGTGGVIVPQYTLANCVPSSAFLEETKTLLRIWQPGEKIDDFGARVLSKNLLGGMSADRVRVFVERVFPERYLRSGGRPATLLKRLLERDQSDQLFADLCLLYAARQNQILRDVVSFVYWPAVSEGSRTLSQKSVLTFFRQAARDYQITERWSEQVKVKVAQSLLKAMTEFKLMEAKGKLVHFQPTKWAVVYLVYDLHFTESTDVGVADHEDWRLFGFRRSEVISTLDGRGVEG